MNEEAVYYDRKRANMFDERKAIKEAVAAGVMKPPIDTLIEINEEAEKAEAKRKEYLTGIEKIFNALEEEIISLFPQNRERGEALERMLRSVKTKKEKIVELGLSAIK